ncbi:hypothetical protein V6M85_00380 [Sulfolobus tengchongensis]|uniref:Uncharacterized protein n=1 Tax=Sulfolobus tengchongensis TaxID=207809 RepID=A0AAX4L0P4_9CREN
MTITQYNINGLRFSVIYEDNVILIYMDVNKEIKDKRIKREEKILYMDVNKEIKDGFLKKIIICNTRISSYICNAIVETKNRNINEDFLRDLYREVVEVSDKVI